MLILHRKKNEQINITHTSNGQSYLIQVSNYNPLLRRADILINNDTVSMSMNDDTFVREIEDMLIILYSVDRGIKLGIKASQEWRIERL